MKVCAARFLRLVMIKNCHQRYGNTDALKYTHGNKTGKVSDCLGILTMAILPTVCALCTQEGAEGILSCKTRSCKPVSIL